MKVELKYPKHIIPPPKVILELDVPEAAVLTLICHHFTDDNMLKLFKQKAKRGKGQDYLVTELISKFSWLQNWLEEPECTAEEVCQGLYNQLSTIKDEVGGS